MDKKRNEMAVKINWEFTKEAAREKFERHYKSAKTSERATRVMNGPNGVTVTPLKQKQCLRNEATLPR